MSPRQGTQAIRIAIIDIGSNTIRLLVADVRGSILSTVDDARVESSLGEDIERHASVSSAAVAAAAEAVRGLVHIADETDPDAVDIFLTAPGRQSTNADQLVAALSSASGKPVRVLTAEQEGQLAYSGAVACTSLNLPSRIAVCDVGGGSTQIAVGSPGSPPDSVTSIRLGSARLSARVGTMQEARFVAASAFEQVAEPEAELALAVGGTARATRCLVGALLNSTTLAAAAKIVSSTEPQTLTRQFGLAEPRTQVILGGVAILCVLQTQLGLPLHVSDGGVREGAALEAASSALPERRRSLNK